MSKPVQAYKCDYCHRCFGRKCNAEQHQAFCKHSPEMRQCRTCVHGVEEIIMWTGYPVKDNPVYGPWCDHHDKGMGDKPYFIDCDTNGVCEDWSPMETEVNMPGTCEHYEYKGWSGWKQGKIATGR